MDRACWSLGVLLLTVTTGWAAVDSFESDTAGWRAQGGTAAVSDQHWKLGTHSLRWDFGPGTQLVRPPDEALQHALAASDGGLKLWLYCEQPVPGNLLVQMGGRRFTVRLGFTGWRAVWVVLREDAEAVAPCAGLVITAPGAASTLFLDAVEIGPVPWSRQGDAQAPYVNAARAGGRYWYTAEDEAAVPPPPAAGLTDADRAAFRELERRVEAWMFGRLDDPRQPVRQRLQGVAGCISWAHKSFERLGLQRRGEAVVGPGAFALTDRHAPHLGADVFQNIALGLAYDVRLNHSQRARQRFLDLIDYAHDQGWAAGSSLGSGYGEPLRLAAYVHAVYILRDELRAAGRLAREQATLRYQLLLGEIYRQPEHPGTSADDLRTLLLHRLLTILLAEDSPDKARDLRCWLRWADAGLAVAPGYGDTIKPDGTVFHHSTAYASAYGNDAVLMSAIVYWLVRDTPFALSRQAGVNLKQALLTLRFMAGPYEFPMGVSGRWPFSGPAMVETSMAFAYLAEALHDGELSAAFARLWDPARPLVQATFGRCGAGIYWCDTPGALPWLLDAAAAAHAEPEPQGHRTLPFAAMNFHRRRQWVASVRGWSQYVWNYEDMPGENRYGRYSSYGTIQIFARGEPVSRAASGYREEGWDWLRPPGATVLRVPLESLPAAATGLRPYTHDPFVGGVSLAGQDGLWAMRFADPVYERSFRFRKSVCFVDETIVCCGSGITNQDTEHATETVLFQTALPTRPAEFPRAAHDSVTALLDAAGNGYYFPAPQAVELRAQHQLSRDDGGAKATEGDFLTAWIDHGRAPQNARYAYAIRPDTTPEALAGYAAHPDFAILRQDDSAHIVRFPAQGITGYALFAALDDLAEGPLRGVSAACLVMARQAGRQLVLAVADPDLRLPANTPRTRYQPGAPATLRLRLTDDWQLAAPVDGVRAVDARTLEVTCRDGLTRQVRLAVAGGRASAR